MKNAQMHVQSASRVAVDFKLSRPLKEFRREQRSASTTFTRPFSACLTLLPAIAPQNRIQFSTCILKHFLP
jgi:hypothetical protein